MDVVPWHYKWVGGLNGKKIPPLVFDNHVVEDFSTGLLKNFINFPNFGVLLHFWMFTIQVVNGNFYLKVRIEFEALLFLVASFRCLLLHWP